MKIGPETVQAILAQYLTTDLSIAKLAELHQVPLTALKARAQKDKWGPKKEIEQERLRNLQREQISKAAMDRFRDRAGQFLDSLATDCEQSLTRVQVLDKPLDSENKWNYESLALREQVMSSLQRRGRTAFGLDTPSQHNTLNVQIGRQASTAPKQLVEDSTVIDVSSETFEGDNQS
jgi:hypothetical protein